MSKCVVVNGTNERRRMVSGCVFHFTQIKFLIFLYLKITINTMWIIRQLHSKKNAHCGKLTLNSRRDYTSVIKSTPLEFLVYFEHCISLSREGESFLSSCYFPRICKVLFLVIMSENEHNPKVLTLQCLQ